MPAGFLRAGAATAWCGSGRRVRAVLHVDPPASDDLYAVYAADDLEAVAEMLGPLITEQVEWTGDAERSYEVETVNSITVTYSRQMANNNMQALIAGVYR